jgi:hypothetical protein
LHYQRAVLIKPYSARIGFFPGKQAKRTVARGGIEKNDFRVKP